MAEKEATSSHLDSMMHVYSTGPLLGTTARLFVTPWDRNTVADGYWQTMNTIQPLINRDIYLADALDKLASKHLTYNAGFGISIDPIGNTNTSAISVNEEQVLLNTPHYNFDDKYFTYDVVDNTATIGLKIDDNYIKAESQGTEHDGIFCNIDDLLYETIDTIQYSAVTAHNISAFTYEYTTASGPDMVVTAGLPHMPIEKTIYCIG